MYPPVTSSNLGLRPVLFLGFLAASIPTALLWVVWDDAGVRWYSPPAHSVVCCSIALLVIAVARWLAYEARILQHPALRVLSHGFLGMAPLYLVASTVREPGHLALVRTMSLTWFFSYSAAVAILFTVRPARRFCRRWMLQHALVFNSAVLILFVLICLGVLGLDAMLFHRVAYAAAIRRITLAVGGVSALLLAVFTQLFYLRKRNTVILFFGISLYVFMLAMLAQTAGAEWSLLWWLGHGLTVIAAFVVAYGIVEASRVRDRMALIETLAAQSQELQKFNADLAHSETRYRSLVNNAPYGIFRLNDTENFEAVNPALFELLGYESEQQLIRLLSWSAVFKDHDDYKGLVGELRRVGRAEEDVVWWRRDGTQVKVHLQCLRIAGNGIEAPSYEGIVKDLSAQSSLEEQLRQSQKMEAVGRLAGGIAHDFNNLLTVIRGYTGMLIETLGETDPRRDDAERVQDAADRAASLTRQLLAFSRKQVLRPTTLDLNSVVSDLSKMLPRVIGEDIDLIFAPGERLASIYADRGQIEQVLMNLVVNSRDAMPDGGKLTLETKNRRIDEKYVRHRRGMVPGEYVMLGVTDTGSGMDMGIQSRIFEPFFTTKEEGKGTGLGLATVYGIVKQSGGYIWCYSERGQGTTFHVFFPLAPAGVPEEPEPVHLQQASRGETVLVLEDEEDLRKMIVRALRQHGYRVLEARSGEEAVSLVREQRPEIQLLLTDLVMVGMRGTEAAQKLADLIPHLRVLYMSGYTENAMFHQKVLAAGTIFLQKPFTIDLLLRKVQEALQKADVSSGVEVQ